MIIIIIFVHKIYANNFDYIDFQFMFVWLLIKIMSLKL